VSPRYLAQLEAGDANISVERLADVCRVLGSTPVYQEDEGRKGDQ